MGRHRVHLRGLLVLSLAFVACPNAWSQAKILAKTGLEVKITTGKKAFRPGEPILIRLEITNTSSESFFIGRDFVNGMDSPSAIGIEIEAPKGQEVTMHAWAGDAVPSRRNKNFASELSKCCFALLPGYSYSTIFPLSQFVVVSELRPGRYRIFATFRSTRIDEDFNYNPLAAHPEEMAQLPYASWTGEVKSNTISITLLSGARPKRSRK